MATKLKASSKFGRNTKKCEKYRAQHTREKNATRADMTRKRRWERDNYQRCIRLGNKLAEMLDNGVSTRSTAYGDVRKAYDLAYKQSEKWRNSMNEGGRALAADIV